MLAHLVAGFGVAIVFFSVLAEAAGLPVPALPTLVMAGALAAAPGAGGWAACVTALALALCAALLADTAWFFVGRAYGSRVLRLLCRISLSRDTCVRRTESFFDRMGPRVLVVSKFIPGLSVVSVPMAGATGTSLPLFLAYDAAGIVLWAGAGLLFGYVFAAQIDTMLRHLDMVGERAALIVGTLLAAYVVIRWARRQWLLRQLRGARISVDELYALMEADPAPVIIDVRGPDHRLLDPYAIPGARALGLHEVATELADLSKDHRVVIYCSCPNEISAAAAAKRLRDLGFTDVRPLAGGLDAWREAGWKLEPIVGDTADGAELGLAKTPARQPVGVAAAAAGSVRSGPCPDNLPASPERADPGRDRPFPGRLAHDAAGPVRDYSELQ